MVASAQNKAEPEEDKYAKSESLAEQIMTFKFFFAGVLITVVATIIVQLIILPIKTQGLEYFYGTTYLFTSLFINIYAVIITIAVVLCAIYFLGYRKIAPWLMGIHFKSRKEVDLSGIVSTEKEGIDAFEYLKKIIVDKAQMNGLEADTESRTLSISGRLLSDIEVKARWEAGAKIIVLEWINNKIAIKIAKEIEDLLIDYAREQVSLKAG